MSRSRSLAIKLNSVEQLMQAKLSEFRGYVQLDNYDAADRALDDAKSLMEAWADQFKRLHETMKQEQGAE